LRVPAMQPDAVVYRTTEQLRKDRTMRKFLVLTVGLIGFTASAQLAAARESCSQRYSRCLSNVENMKRNGMEESIWKSYLRSCDSNWSQCLSDGSWGKVKPPGSYDTWRNTRGVNPGAGAPSHTTPASSTGAALNSGLKAGAPSQTAPAASTGAALNTQAVTGLTGIDKSAALPSQLSDRLNRMRR
jgi:hypothetical protein